MAAGSKLLQGNLIISKIYKAMQAARPTPMSRPPSQRSNSAWEDIPEDQHTVIRVGDSTNKVKNSEDSKKGRRVSSTVSCIATAEAGSMVMNVQ